MAPTGPAASIRGMPQRLPVRVATDAEVVLGTAGG